jgi:hypothetical protein
LFEKLDGENQVSDEQNDNEIEKFSDFINKLYNEQKKNLRG